MEKSEDQKNSGFKFSLNPLYVGLFLIYGATRAIEYLTNTEYTWARIWNKIVDFFGDGDFNMYFTATCFYNIFFLYWSIGLMFLIVDFTMWPKWIRKYKVQEGKNEPVDLPMVWKTAKVVLRNQIFISVPLLYFSYLYRQHKGGFTTSLRDVPSFYRVVIDIGVSVVIEEIGFFYAHWLVHQKPFYKHIHKQHHEWQAPIAIAALYAHPVEHILANMIPVVLGPTIMQSHLSTMWVYYTILTISVLANHTGYHLPFLPSPEFHDYHHARFHECFGKIGFLDTFHNTDKHFRKTIYNARHRILLSFKSARELVPDKNEKVALDKEF
jgi:methylsterol monooxygenase